LVGKEAHNDRKTSENHPDRAGSIMVDGKLYFLNGRLKKTKDGKPYLSLSIKAKQEQTATGGGSPKRDMDDEIPF